MVITPAWSLGSAGCTSVAVTFSLIIFVGRDCKMNAGDMRVISSSDVATVLRRLGGVL